MIGSTVAVWFNTKGHWLVSDGTDTIEASWVRLQAATTDLKQDGFRDLSGGPRGIVRGVIEAWSPVSSDAIDT